MLNALLGSKINQSQAFDEKGNRIPVTHILAGPCHVVRIKNQSKDGADSVVLGLGNKRAITVKKPALGIFKKAGLENIAPRFLKEVKVDNLDDIQDRVKPGSSINVADVFQEGDFVQVTSTSKGKGFAGVVKRHHFRGGPRTHGQSDRERAPGSIGQSTTPGRVYKGKRMAGRMGNQTVTIKNLQVVKVDPAKNLLTIKGLVAGGKNSLLLIKKMD